MDCYFAVLRMFFTVMRAISLRASCVRNTWCDVRVSINGFRIKNGRGDHAVEPNSAHLAHLLVHGIAVSLSSAMAFPQVEQVE